MEWPYFIITAAFTIVGIMGYFHLELGWIRPRPAIAYWSALLCVPYGGSALAIAALDSYDIHDLDLDWPFCMLAFCVVWYSFGYGREFGGGVGVVWGGLSSHFVIPLCFCPFLSLSLSLSLSP